MMKPLIHSWRAPPVFQCSWDPDMASLQDRQRGDQCVDQARHNPKLQRGIQIGYPR